MHDNGVLSVLAHKQTEMKKMLSSAVITLYKQFITIYK